MIRVNLLPVKAVKRREYSRQQLLLFVIVVLVEVAALYMVYTSKSEELDEAENNNKQVQDEIKKLERDAKDFTKVKEQREAMLHQRDVRNELHQKRMGPVRVLDELRFILYQPKGTDADALKEQRGWNVKWNSQNLWLTLYAESEGVVTIEGFAKTNDDVAEFFKRMTTSPYFATVDLTRSELDTSTKYGVDLVKFVVECRVTYRLAGEES